MEIRERAFIAAELNRLERERDTLLNIHEPTDETHFRLREIEYFIKHLGLHVCVGNGSVFNYQHDMFIPFMQLECMGVNRSPPTRHGKPDKSEVSMPRGLHPRSNHKKKKMADSETNTSICTDDNAKQQKMSTVEEFRTQVNLLENDMLALIKKAPDGCDTEQLNFGSMVLMMGKMLVIRATYPQSNERSSVAGTEVPPIDRFRSQINVLETEFLSLLKNAPEGCDAEQLKVGSFIIMMGKMMGIRSTYTQT